MVKWISNFISYRQCAIIFPGSRREMRGINTGIPQGSPRSPILFVIYVEPLHDCIDPSIEFTSSYVDDIQTTVSFNSWLINSKVLEEAFTMIKNIATSLGLEFSTYKTDLIHWWTPREKVARREHPIVVDGECIQPAPKAVKWLGFHFENNHGTWTHYANRLALHQQKITLHQIWCRCVLTYATLNLRPLHPVRAEMGPLCPVHPELRPLCPLRPVRPELPCNARSNSMHLEPNQYTTFCPDILVKATLPPVHPDSSISTIAYHDLPLSDARFRGTPEYFLA